MEFDKNAVRAAATTQAHDAILLALLYLDLNKPQLEQVLRKFADVTFKQLLETIPEGLDEGREFAQEIFDRAFASAFQVLRMP